MLLLYVPYRQNVTKFDNVFQISDYQEFYVLIWKQSRNDKKYSKKNIIFNFAITPWGHHFLVFF